MAPIKGFLTQVARAILGVPEPRNTLPAIPDMDADLRALEEKWGRAPFIRAADFISKFHENVDAYPDPDPSIFGYASFKQMGIVSGLQRAMMNGSVPFFFPRPGTLNYPPNEQNMFFAEHCYVPISYFIEKARDRRDRGFRHDAGIYIMTLKHAAENAKAIRPEEISSELYGYEDGKNAPSRYFMSAYEPGASFCLVLRHNKGEMKRVRDTSQNLYLAPPPADTPKLPQP